MSKSINYHYKKNFLLLSTFIGLALITMVLGLVVAYRFVQNAVENEFVSKKADVLDRNLQEYNDLFSNRIPEISFYQGYLDSAGAKAYCDSVLAKYRFVRRIVFYDIQIGSVSRKEQSLSGPRLDMRLKAVYQFGENVSARGRVLYKQGQHNKLDLETADVLNNMSARFSAFTRRADTSRSINNDEINEVFYSIVPGRITFLNIPRREEVIVYKNMISGDADLVSSYYEQDLFSYYIDPKRLPLVNNHHELYEKIEIKPLFYESLDTDPSLLTTESALPGALAAYKLYYSANKEYLSGEINRRFGPIALSICLLFVILGSLAVLIYRNLNFNHRLFQLQYDFVNNLSHEFKTPVSVIKIAGNNIASSKELTERARQHYGRILGEEADKLNNLLNTLLSFTQIENKSIKLKLERIDLEEFCYALVDSYKIKYPDFQISYSIEDVKYFVSDRVLLGSVFQNLIDNAYKYSRPDNKKLDIVIFRNKRQLFFKFVDEGIGIPSDELNNIFEKFYRVKSQYNQQGSVGIGLAFCRELIQFMNGNITVKSRLGEGSVFMVELPYS
ncbi:sensor histidine kinase [Olivibacter sitiensis]|uniref:sensor histidine kinase n=1 Tax=Olivibacter sitiensis TaxID=376470 RepID=UPI000420897D|nr:HAMP domain-containing sensor histidine kinase [Olivibacter sitiensis]